MSIFSIRRVSNIALAALMTAPGAALAQTAPAPVAVAAPAPADPAVTAAAQQVAAKLLPAGIYKRMFSQIFDQMGNMMPDMVGKLPLRQIAQLGGISDTQAKAIGDAKLGEIADIYDPHWHERTKVMMEAMSTMIGDLMGEFEPNVRATLARGYSREFTLAELNEILAFLATPTGSHYADRQFSMFMDPQMMKDMGAMMPEMLKRLPAMIEQIKKASASLPPPRKIKDLTPAERARLAELLGVPAAKLSDPKSGM